jgi:hypothetical protein
MALGEEPVHDKGVQHKDHAHQRLPQPHGSVLVISAADRAGRVIGVLVLVPAKKRSNLHDF